MGLEVHLASVTVVREPIIVGEQENFACKEMLSGRVRPPVSGVPRLTSQKARETFGHIDVPGAQSRISDCQVDVRSIKTSSQQDSWRQAAQDLRC